MNQQKLYELAEKVNFLALSHYLKSIGWTRQKGNAEEIAIFTYNDSDEILVPQSREFSDYSKAILSAAIKLASLADKEPEEFLSDLILPPADVIRFRIVNRDTEEGTITFDDGFNLLESARLAVYTSACDILQPEHYHRRLSFKGADEFIKHCRLGQTQRGSYIASVICPFVEQTAGVSMDQMRLFDSPDKLSGSFTRQVTSNLLSSVSTVKKAIESGQTESLLETDLPQKISANFLEAVIGLSDLENQYSTELEIIPAWSPLITAPALPRSVKLSAEYIQPIRSLISKMIPGDETDHGEFIGRISQVKADPDVAKRQEGEVTFVFIGDNDKVVRAKVILKIDDYRKACEAHEFGQLVKISGTLISADRTRIIQNPVFDVVK